MHYPPQLIIYLAVSNYLTEEQMLLLKNDLSKRTNRTNNNFLQVLAKHFDIENFLTKPYIWQDIWIYNHIMYDRSKSWARKNGLLAKYEQEILLPQKDILNKAKHVLSQLDLQ